MSTCAFCGVRRSTGRDLLAHRMTPTRVRTVKVCAECVGDAVDAGYYVTDREAEAAGDLQATHRARVTNSAPL